MKKTPLFFIISAIIILFAGCNEDKVFEAGEIASSGNINGYGYVDLGLPSGLKWATCNVGANYPEDFGNYYAWGETETKSSYTESNSVTHGEHIDDISGNPQYDVARKKWGGSWRLPTMEELEELEDKCTWKWTKQSGVSGYKITGPNGNSIFFPAAGRRDGSSLINVGYYGLYWSSTPIYYDGVYYGYILGFYNYDYAGSVSVGSIRRYDGLTVRPITE